MKNIKEWLKNNKVKVMGIIAAIIAGSEALMLFLEKLFHWF